MRVHVIACGVLAIDIKHIAGKLDISITSEFLEGGLHDRPVELHKRLQAAIDRASASGECDRIAIGYGVCGRGTVGIHARNVPLAIPKAHDCIALFLGSDSAYRQEFARFPGTYYISAGWFEEKVQPTSSQKEATGDSGGSSGGNCNDTKGRNDTEFARLADKYGEENAGAITDFLGSWKRNYQRAAFVDTGSAHRSKYESYAKAMAEEFGWKYEALPGNLSLLEKMLAAHTTTDEVLIVPPHHVTAFDAITGKLKAVPLWEKHPASPAEDTMFSSGEDTDSARGSGPRVRCGLGIDAGGTYTDVVIYDFESSRVLGKAKALTTKWDYTAGITEALAQLDAGLLDSVQLVSVSTTLATNAIVEGAGQTVGLLVMPPYGLYHPSDFPHDPKAVLSARMEMDGTEISPVDGAEVRRLAREMTARHVVGAFAVSGFAAAINPSHELQVKAILLDETGLPVTCGHELSEMLNFQTRADTAVLNARIIPRLEKLIREVEESLRSLGILAPVMVVKGDGSLMSTTVARQRPIETILSGPAASVAGAVRLTGCSNALVVDMGGTTSDTACVRGGHVKTCEEGARVGRWKTHVKALDMRTIGLGGDSLISFERTVLHVGPRRVAPVSWLAAQQPETFKAIDCIESRIDDLAITTKPSDILALTSHTEGMQFDEQEARIIDVLRERPHCLPELAEKAGADHWALLRLKRLEEHYIVQRCGLTPTDLLHVRAEFVRWNADAAERMTGILSRVTVNDTGRFISMVMDEVVRKLTIELLKKQLDSEVDSDAMDTCPVCRELLARMINGQRSELAVTMELKHPVVGLGAPIGFFLPQAARMLGARAVIPDDADVANAIGAITSGVVISRQAHIRPNDSGRYAVYGLPEDEQDDGGTVEPPSFEQFDEAHSYAARRLQQIVRRLGRSAGTSVERVEMHVEDMVSSAGDGTEIFLERRLNARLAGPPDIARLAV